MLLLEHGKFSRPKVKKWSLDRDLCVCVRVCEDSKGNK